MIRIDRQKGCIYISRCEYIRRGDTHDEASNRKMGDGDIVIPLPEHMIDTTYDHTGRSDGQNAVEIIAEIRRRLGLPA